MSAHAETERIAEPSDDEAATPDLRAVPVRRSRRASAPGDRRIAAGILGGAAVIYVVLGVLIYVAVAALA